MTTTKIYLDTPNDIHARIKQLQLEWLEKGEKATLRDVYYEVLRKGLEVMELEKNNNI